MVPLSTCQAVPRSKCLENEMDAGNFPGGRQTELKRAVAAVRTRLKDPEASRAETEMTEMAEAQEHAAHLGMAAMLQVWLSWSDRDDAI